MSSINFLITFLKRWLSLNCWLRLYQLSKDPAFRGGNDEELFILIILNVVVFFLRSLDLCTKMKRHNSLRKKNRLSNLYVGEANYNLDNHVVLCLRSRGDGSPWVHRHGIYILVEVTALWECESRPDDFHLHFQVKRPTSLGLSGVSSKRHRVVEKAMPPLPGYVVF